jgi:glycosyltransferase involved in cell wall biosynthesis
MAQRHHHLVIDARNVRALPSGVGTAILRQLEGVDRLLRSGEGRDEWKVSVLRYAPDLRHQNFRQLWAPFRSLDIIDTGASHSSHPRGDFWQQVTLPRLLDRLGADVLYSPAFIGPLRTGAVAHLVMIHDDLVYSHPKSYPFQFRWYLRTLARLTARSADRVIFPSRDARARVVRRLSLPRDRAGVVPHGIDHTVFEPAPLEDRDPIALCIANAERRKNHEVLIRAVKGLKGVRVLFVGFSQRERSRIQELEALGQNKRWEIVPPLSVKGLVSLLKLASMVVLPSRAEGFGMPVLEAMATGTPLILSDLRVFREIAGEAAVYLPPDDEKAWSAAMAEALARGDAVRRRVQAGLDCISNHTLENNARLLFKEAALAIRQKRR